MSKIPGKFNVFKGAPKHHFKNYETNFDKITQELQQAFKNAEEKKKARDEGHLTNKKQKRNKRPRVECEKCNLPFSKPNIAKHQRQCQGLNAKSKLHSEKTKLEKENENLRLLLEKALSENKQLKKQLKFKLPKYSMEDITESKSLNTKKSYLRNWNRYHQYCQENDLLIRDPRSANLYLRNLTRKMNESKNLSVSTKNMARAVLIYGFKKIYDQDISVLVPKKNKFVISKKKYALSCEEIVNFMVSLSDVSDFWAFFILIFSACRVSALAMLKKEDCDLTESTINLCETKTSKLISFKIDDEKLKQHLFSFVNSHKSGEYLFYNSRPKKCTSIYANHPEETPLRRSKYVSRIIKNILLKSETFKNVLKSKFAVCAHMLRKTHAQTIMDQIISEGLKKTKLALLHSERSSTAINHYLDVPRVNQPIFDELITRIVSMKFPENPEQLFETNFVEDQEEKK